jgi:hypothetical protein
LTDLSGYAKKPTANGDTRSGLRLRFRIGVAGRAADADPPRVLIVDRDRPANLGCQASRMAVDAPCAVATFSEVLTRIQWRCDEH